jgi:drug/metabolite transporter (DMT)-like permease
MKLKYMAVLLLLGAVWGTSFLFIKLGVAEMPPETLVALRISIAAVILVVVLYGRGQRLPASRSMWRDFFVIGTIGLIIPYALITWAEQTIPSGMAAILNATTPLFAVLLTYVWTREEQLSGWKLIGVALGFVGVVVAVGLADFNPSNTNIVAELAVLAAAACYGFSGIYARRAFRGVPALVPATGQMVAGAIIAVPLALILRGVPALPSATAIGAVLALAVFGTAVAYILLYWLIERLGASRSSMVTYLLPPFALVYGAIFLHEQIGLNALLGLGLVVVGILLANGVLRLPALRRSQGSGVRGQKSGAASDS